MPKKKDRFKKNKLPSELKDWVTATLAFLGAVVMTLSFLNLAGTGGVWINKISRFLIGRTALVLPIFLLGLGITILLKKKAEVSWRVVLLQISLLLIGASGILATQDLIHVESNLFHQQYGGWIGWAFAWPIFNFFGEWVCSLVFITFFVMGGIIFVYPFWLRRRKGKDIKGDQQENKIKPKKKKEAIKINNKDFKEPRVNWNQAKQFIKKQKKGEMLSPSQIIKKQLAAKTANSGQGNYQLPSVEFLAAEQGSPETGSIKSNSAIIKSTFSDFGLEVRMTEVNVGPTVTQYALRPPEGVRLSKITSLSRNLALALAAHPIRMEAPIPGRSLVGIEVPNKTRVLVRLRNLVEDPKFINGPPLELCIGRDVAGTPVYADLGKMPHLLVAGATGAGKTVALNSLITSLLYKNTPAQTKLLLIDPKKVEFSLYNGLPHLLTPVISNPDEVVGALEWLIEEMERRFTQILKLQVRDIKAYNKIARSKSVQPLPYIVVVVDELADLMATKGREIESAIVRLAQKSRAVGIHLVIATQRPSVEVITGLIKANITCRMAFQVASQIDSRTIIDVAGAEKLLGNGDMLFLSPERTKTQRVQGVFLSEKEVLKVVHFFEKNNKSVEGESSLEKELKESLKRKQQEGVMSFGEDSLYEEARDLVLQSERASASFLQRRLRVGYARAARLLDMLESKGIIGPGEGSKPRKINYSFEEKDNEEEKEQ